MKKILALISPIVFLLVFVISTHAQGVYPLPVLQRPSAPVCPGPLSQGNANCNSKVITNKAGRPLATAGPTGYGPLQFHTAYNLPNNAAGIPVIAIVDAYDNPNAYSDLTTYSNQFGIPVLPQCSGPIAASPVPCFSKINQNGGTSYPRFNSGWALEISLDVQVAHAICQNCSILLVEASSNSFSNLLKAENQAAAQGANAISNSWSAGEFSSETAYDSYFNHPGIAITAASGDNGYSAGTQYPAASKYVVSVGGTTLQLNSDSSYNNELVWSGTGSGCSSYETKPSWQTDIGCAKRTLNDVSADADPNTGAAVYDSAGYGGQYGWFQVGGTSLSSPLIAAVFALAGNYQASTLYANSSYLHDVVSGNNGSCNPLYLCTGLLGFDGPTGLGTPNGLFAFNGTGPTPTPTPILTATPTPTPTPIPEPVSVSITNPTNGGTVARRSTVTITTSASGTVTQVSFTVNGSLVCSASLIPLIPFSCDWNVSGKPNVTYVITATATDGLGGSASDTITVTAQ